jgi:GAF domain-containing protein
VLALACEELEMDAAMVSEVRAAHEVVLWAAGNGRIAGAAAGTSAPLENTICRRLLDGTIENIVPDVGANPLLRDLPSVRDGPIGAYIGVALTVEAARWYVLCCLACEARPSLGEADVRFLRGLVESVRARLDRSELSR